MTNSGTFTVHRTSTLSMDALCEAANAAFAQYLVPVQFTSASLADFCRVYSIDLTHSVFAQDAEGRTVGMTLLGSRGTRGWCGGLAVVPERRGQGVGRVLANGLIEAARARGLRTLHLECLTENAAALRLYEKAGFQPVREVAILSGAFADVAAPHSEMPGTVIEPCDAIDAFSIATALSAPAPVWQREPVSLLSQGGHQGYAALSRGRFCAVLLAHSLPAQNVLQIGVIAFSNAQAAHTLLNHAIKETNAAAADGRFACSNEPEGGPIVSTLVSMGLVVKMRQHEMMLTL